MKQRTPVATVLCTTIATSLLLALTAAQTAEAATVTVSSTCTLAKAVATVNAGVNQSPCTHSGSFGSNDTVVVPVGTFYIGSSIDITRSMTIHGGGKWSTFLYVNDSSLYYAIRVKSPSIVVKMDNLFF